MPEVIFTGPAGRLEGRYQHKKRDDKHPSPIALVLHPHPQGGGTMNSRVTFELFNMFESRGFSTLRFNFRGVGRSQGVYDGGIGELSDAAAALDWMQSFNPNAPTCWIAGHSFGAWISMQLLMRRPEIAGFISVSPPSNMYDFSFLAPCPSSGLIVTGRNDAVVPEADVDRLAERLKTQKGIIVEYLKVEGANHFYSTHTPQLMDVCTAYLDKRLIADAEKPRDA